MNFTDMFQQEAEPIYQAIIKHPFNQELANSTLAREKFAFYMHQDALYLADFGRALTIIGSRAITLERMLDFVKFAEGAVDKAIEITDRTARTTSENVRELMKEAFVKSCHLEWMFWDSTYRLEAWKP